MEDLRRHPRFPVEQVSCDCLIRATRYSAKARSKVFSGEIVNVSSRGIMLKTTQSIPEDAWIDIRFVIDHEPVEAVGQPRWSKSDALFHYYGFQFFDINCMSQIGSMFGNG